MGIRRGVSNRSSVRTGIHEASHQQGAISSILVLEPLNLLATVRTSVGGGKVYTRSKSHV